MKKKSAEFPQDIFTGNPAEAPEQNSNKYFIHR